MRNSLGRFLAIAGICALGVGFFGGLQMTCGSMKSELTDYYNSTNMMDIRIVSDKGISEENIDSFKNIEGVSNVMPAYETDILTNFGNDQCAVRVHSLPNNIDASNKDYINQIQLSSGDWPQYNNECVLAEDVILDKPPQIGDEIDVLECSTGIDSTVNVQKLKVVGFVHSSYYAATVQMGPSTLGKGILNQFAYVPSSFFKDSFPYSEVFLTIGQARNCVTGSDDYQDLINEVMHRLDDMCPGQAEIRSAQIKAEAQKQIDEGMKSIAESQKSLNDNYSLFNSTKSSTFATLNNAIEMTNKMIDTSRLVELDCNNNVMNLNQDNILVNKFDTVMDGLPLIINELNNTIQINNSLANLVDDKEVKSQIDGINYVANLALGVASTFYDALKLSYSEEIYNSIIDNYNLVFAQLINVLPARILVCDGVVANCQSVLETHLYPNKNKANLEFDKNEQKLIDGQAQIDDALVKIKQSQAEVDAITTNFYVMDRSKNMGAVSYGNDADRIANIANVFPLMFFFVALLIVLTSMTRMVEEERTAIGTYKALGFSKLQIANKYLLYGIFASITGSVVGLALLSQFFPYIIAISYNTVYDVPVSLPMPFDFFIGVASLILGVGITILATMMSAVRSMKLSPARLMIPNAPKAGKRILLEYIRPVWRLLNFNWKISFRNMFLYKKRLFMTLIGIAGCTALLLTAFGLHDAISDIMNKQFDEISHDNFKVVFNKSTSELQQNDVVNSAKCVDENFDSALIYEENVLCMPEGHPNASATIVVPKNTEQFQNLRVIRNRINEEYFNIDEQGVYLTEKLANLMNVHAGDVITVYNQDLIGNAGSEKHELNIAGIVENYVAHYIYMSSNVYKNYFNKNCEFATMIAQSSLNGCDQQVLIDAIKNNKCVKSAYYTTNTRQTYERSLKTVDSVVIILIISAGLLAFVVLYNLININICERLREIATLKVLGSNRKEINFYVHRETFMLSLLGAILGLIFGCWLTQFVCLSAEVDYVMFGKEIHLISYVMSFLITMLFTIVVVFFMRKKLFSISMVESLKSVE